MVWVAELSWEDFLMAPIGIERKKKLPVIIVYDFIILQSHC